MNTILFYFYDISIFYSLKGASTGIGKAVCELFAREGASVIGIGLKETCNSIKDLPNNGLMPHSYYNCDVSNESNVKSVFEQVLKV